MTRIVGIAGSLREGSYNAALLRAAASLMPDESELVVCSIRGVPLYDGDVEEAEGIPPLVSSLKDAVAAADGLLLVTPEYNNSIPGVFKNAIDWMSRPPSDIARVFGEKPVGLIGASPGRAGTLSAQTAWLTVFRALGLVPWFGGSLYVSGVRGLVDDRGVITDEATRKRLRGYLEGFAAFVAQHGPGGVYPPEDAPD
jgi:chromate reductase, NAD(P)H dehydrogenase (quinone)